MALAVMGCFIRKGRARRIRDNCLGVGSRPGEFAAQDVEGLFAYRRLLFRGCWSILTGFVVPPVGWWQAGLPG